MEEESNLELSAGTRLLISIPLAILVILIIVLYFNVILCSKNIDVSKLGIPEILITSILILIVVNIPWNKLGFRIKKIGMIELEHVVKVQAQNNSKELADLQKQIDELKKHGKVAENTSDLDTLIIRFLTEYKSYGFSSSRVRDWGARQKSFENLSNYTTENIRESLRRLLSQNVLKTTISKKGNTLYKLQ